jgi:hypothetical protein
LSIAVSYGVGQTVDDQLGVHLADTSTETVRSPLTDEPSNVSRLDPSGADQIGRRASVRNRKVVATVRERCV